MSEQIKPSPIEVWLTQQNIEIECMVVREDESTFSLGVDSLSMRGAQREITGHLIDDGYTPVGRWEAAMLDERRGAEYMRRFKLA